MTCHNCGGEDEEHEEGCIQCPGSSFPCLDRVWESELACSAHRAYAVAEIRADREGRL
jgi:hypothetical protein